MRKMDSLEECLFNAFANTEYFDPQERRTMWAILEGLRRLKTLDSSWRRLTRAKTMNAIEDARSKREASISIGRWGHGPGTTSQNSVPVVWP